MLVPAASGWFTASITRLEAASTRCNPCRKRKAGKLALYLQRRARPGCAGGLTPNESCHWPAQGEGRENNADVTLLSAVAVIQSSCTMPRGETLSFGASQNKSWAPQHPRRRLPVCDTRCNDCILRTAGQRPPLFDGYSVPEARRSSGLLDMPATTMLGSLKRSRGS